MLLIRIYQQLIAQTLHYRLQYGVNPAGLLWAEALKLVEPTELLIEKFFERFTSLFSNFLFDPFYLG